MRNRYLTTFGDNIGQDDQVLTNEYGDLTDPVLDTWNCRELVSRLVSS